jgi:uncharacterized damage-inducible protein DinB
MHRSLLAAAFAAIVLSTAAGAQAPVPGIRGDFLASYGQAERKFEQLAEATPWEKYSWRPGKGVRSVCEVFLHVAGDGYVMGEPFGVKAPAGVDLKTIETCPADKAQVIATLKTSYAAFKAAVTAMKDSDLEQDATIFGFKQSKRAWLMGTAEHAGEHLGQSIAYARMNGIVPPWSK